MHPEEPLWGAHVEWKRCFEFGGSAYVSKLH